MDRRDYLGATLRATDQVVSYALANLAYSTVNEYTDRLIKKGSEYLNMGTDGTIHTVTPYIPPNPNIANNEAAHVLENNSVFNMELDRLLRGSDLGNVQNYGNYMGYRTEAGLSQLSSIPSYNPANNRQDPIVPLDNNPLRSDKDDFYRDLVIKAYDALREEINLVRAGQFRVLSEREQRLSGGNYVQIPYL